MEKPGPSALSFPDVGRSFPPGPSGTTVIQPRDTPYQAGHPGVASASLSSPQPGGGPALAAPAAGAGPAAASAAPGEAGSLARGRLLARGPRRPRPAAARAAARAAGPPPFLSPSPAVFLSLSERAAATGGSEWNPPRRHGRFLRGRSCNRTQPLSCLVLPSLNPKPWRRPASAPDSLV